MTPLHAERRASNGAASSFTCPMHPEIRQLQPGTCPKCGMALEAIVGRQGASEQTGLPRNQEQAADVPRTGRIGWPVHRQLRARAFLWGFCGAVALVAVYVGVLAVANSLDHAVDELRRLRYWMVPLIVGFAIQLGLFAYARGAAGGQNTTPAHGIVASGSASTLSMVACCAHHLTDVLPLIGLAGAAVFLVEYQTLFLLLGLLSNVVGLVYLLGLLRTHGLFPEQPSVLSFSLRWPVDRAFLPVVMLSTAVFIVATLVAMA